jgi:hypothetical protein
MNKIVIDDDDADIYIYRLQWVLGGFVGDLGGFVGDDDYSSESLVNAATREERETIAASLAVSAFDRVEWHGTAPYFATRKLAMLARKAAKAAMLAISNVEQPWPDWALKAKANGWTAPKGWKP